MPGAAGQNLGMKLGDLAAFGASSLAYIGLGVSHPDPRGVEAMPDGGVLVADAANHLVLRMDASGQARLVKYAPPDDDGTSGARSAPSGSTPAATSSSTATPNGCSSST